jgi:Flp pilus assembly protein TadG
MSRFRSDTGAAAVEFALVILPLVLLLTGIIDFGRAYNQQLTVTAAAREGARTMAVQTDPATAATTARNATITAAAGLSPSLSSGQVTISPSTCTPGVQVTVTVTYPLTTLTGMFDSVLSGKNLIGTGVMRCGG